MLNNQAWSALGDNLGKTAFMRCKYHSVGLCSFDHFIVPFWGLQGSSGGLGDSWMLTDFTKRLHLQNVENTFKMQLPSQDNMLWTWNQGKGPKLRCPLTPGGHLQRQGCFQGQLLMLGLCISPCRAEHGPPGSAWRLTVWAPVLCALCLPCDPGRWVTEPL